MIGEISWTIEEILSIARDVPLRTTNKAVSQQPKTFGLTTMGPSDFGQMMLSASCLVNALLNSGGLIKAPAEPSINLQYPSNRQQNLQRLLNNAASSNASFDQPQVALPAPAHLALPAPLQQQPLALPAPLQQQPLALPPPAEVQQVPLLGSGVVAAAPAFEGLGHVDVAASGAKPHVGEPKVGETGPTAPRDIVAADESEKHLSPQPKIASVEPQEKPAPAMPKISLQASLAKLQHARDATKPGLKRPAAAVEKEGLDSKSNGPKAKAKGGPKPKAKGGPKPKAKGGPKPKAKGGSKPKAKDSKKKAASKEGTKKKIAASTRADMKAQRLAKVPKKELSKFKDGCARCRFAKNCTVSCWLLRGWDI